MFGQFVVHLDYMLSAAPACQQPPPDGMSGTPLAPNNKVHGIFVR